eukprot:scaffold82127_cov31-Tisochrysis_lutea.AAC.2
MPAGGTASSSRQSLVCSTLGLGGVSSASPCSPRRKPIRSCSSRPPSARMRRKKTGLDCVERTHAVSCAIGEPSDRSGRNIEGRTCSNSLVDQHMRATSAVSRHAQAKGPREGSGIRMKMRCASSDTRSTSEKEHACAAECRRSAAS